MLSTNIKKNIKKNEKKSSLQQLENAYPTPTQQKQISYKNQYFMTSIRHIHTLYHAETSSSTSGIFSQEVPIPAYSFENLDYAESMQTDVPMQ